MVSPSSRSSLSKMGETSDVCYDVTMGRGQSNSSSVASRGCVPPRLRSDQRSYLGGIKVITGEELGPQLHTVGQEWSPAPRADLYREAEDATFIDCIPYGGFWTEQDHKQGKLSIWVHHRDGDTYRLHPKPEAKVLVVDTPEKAERLLAAHPVYIDGYESPPWRGEPLAVSCEALRDQGFDGIWVSDEVARMDCFGMWDLDSIFWFSKEWPFLPRRTRRLPWKPSKIDAPLSV